MALPPVFVELKGSIGDLKAKLGEASRDIDRMTRKGASDFDRMAAMGRGAALGIGAAFGAAAVVGIKFGSDLEQTTAKVGAVFGTQSKTIMDFGKTVTDAYGMSNEGGLAAASTFGNLLISMGMARQEAAEMSKRLVVLGADLGALNNMDVKSVFDRLRSGLLGEQEAMEVLGVSISEAGLKQKAFDMGLVESTTGVLPPLIKSQAAYAVMLEQTKTATGAAEREQDSFAGQTRRLKAEFDNAAASLGTVLIPKVLAVGKAAAATAGFLDRNRAVTLTLAGAISTVLVPAMGAYAVVQARAFGTAALANIGRVPQMFLAVGAAMQGTTAAAVVLNGSMASVAATTALGAAPFVVLGAGIYGVTRTMAAQRAEAERLNATFLRTNPTIDQLNARLAEYNRTASQGLQIQIPFTEKTLFFNDAAKKAAAASRDLVTQVDAMHDPLTGAAAASRQAAEGADKAAQADGYASAEAKKRSETVDKLASTLTGLYTAERAQVDANQRVADATQRLADARAKVNQLSRAGVIDTKAVAAATKEHERAAESLADALRAQEDAQASLDEIMRPTPRTQAEAAIAAQQSANDVVRANLRVRQAEKDLKELQKSGKATQDELTAAVLDVTEARNGVTTATFAQEDAERRVADLLPENIQYTDAYRDAAEQLDAAKQGVADATDAERTAADKLRTAQAPDPDLIAALTTAKKEERTAQAELTGAKDAATQAAFEHAVALSAEREEFSKHIDLVGALQEKLLGLQAINPAAAPYIQQLISLLGTAGAAGRGGYVEPVLVNGLPGGFHFAAGGRPPVGRAVKVGEYGEETAVFDSPVRIYRNGESPPSSGTGAGVVIMPGGIVIQEASNPSATQRAVVAALAEFSQRNGGRP